MGEPGVSAEAERAVDQGLVAADRGVGADLEVRPAQLVFDLFAALLDPVPDPVDPHDLGQVRGRVRAVRLARAAGAGQVGGQVPGGLVRQGARVGSGHHQAGQSVRAPPRSEEHTSELQSRRDLVCRLLLEKKKKNSYTPILMKKKNRKNLQ